MINKKNLLKIDITSFMKEFDPQLIIGETPEGGRILLKLSQIVHLLFWGQSGSGKSVFVLQLLLQILFKTNPKTLQFILIDPLRVSFKDFKELPHLLTPVWNSPRDAASAINTMMDINNERYSFLEGAGFENIYDYNNALLKNKLPYKQEDGSKIFTTLELIPQKYINKTKTKNYRIWEPISQIVIMFDEFNKLMLEEEFWGKNPEKAESPSLKKLTGISEQARKSGLIIILGTQKITASTVPTKIRGNMKTRICLKVDNLAASRTILGDSVTNKSQGAKLSWFWDWLVYNLELSTNQALRFQWAYSPEEDMLNVINAFIKIYWSNDFEYIQVNQEYAKDLEDLEMLPIDPSIFTEGLPDIMIVQDNIFMKAEYQKVLSDIIRNPKIFDPKMLALNYPSISSKNFKILNHRLIQGGILALNKIEDLEDNNNKKEKGKKEESYFGLNLKLPWLNLVLNRLQLFVQEPTDWDSIDTDDSEYQNLLMKLILIRLNKIYIPAAKKENISINSLLD